MNGYTKLFSSIITSTIWQEPKETKVLWVTMLALADRDGYVAGSVPGLARMAGLTLQETERALATLRAPDPYSRTKTADGRRIADADGGWNLVNHAKYRRMLNAEERREYLRVKQAERRASVNKCQQMSTSVAPASTVSTHAEAEAEAEADKSITDETLGESPSAPIEKKRCAGGPAPTSKAKISDDEWLLSLTADPAYAGIDVATEHRKMLRWCETNNRQPTRRRFVNWLNRCERPMTAKAGTAAPQAARLSTDIPDDEFFQDRPF
jgi:hypothetical protein